MPSPQNDEHRDTDGASVSRRRNAVQHAYHSGRGVMHTVQGEILERPRLMEALEEVDVARIALTADFRVLSNPGLQPHWTATMVSSDEIARALGEDERERTVFGYLWLAVRKTIEQHVRNGLIDCHSALTEGHQLEAAVFDQFLAELGCAMMEVIEGPHITFLPLAASADAGTIVVRARRVVASFVALGRTQDQVVISIPATAEGIDAGRILQTEHGILVNLTHVVGPDHAAACAAAVPYAITLLLAHTDIAPSPQMSKTTADVQAVADCFRTHDLPTLLIGGTLPHIDDACEFTMLDALLFTTEQAAQAEYYTKYPSITESRAVTSRKSNATFSNTKSANVPHSQRRGKLYDVMQLTGSRTRATSGRCVSDIDYRPESVRTIMGYLQSELYWRISLTRPLTSVNCLNSLPARSNVKTPKRQRNSSDGPAPTSKRSKASESEEDERDSLPTPPVPLQTREQIAELSSSLVDGSWRRRLLTGVTSKPSTSPCVPHKPDENSSPADAGNAAQVGQKARPTRPLPRRAALSQISSTPTRTAAAFGVDGLT
ncbi:unnamed protein product [Peniophora sp. CBMAI 1063]|nr:unnamed protein product [Peniophora sp. CBMAI 1063]